MYIGIDLGGTNIAAGIVDDNGKLIYKSSVPTHKERHYSAIIKDMAELVKTIVADAGYDTSDFKSIGIGCPGTIDNSNGIVVYSDIFISIPCSQIKLILPNEIYFVL